MTSQHSVLSRESMNDHVRRTGTVTIAAGQSLSGPFNCDMARWAFVQTPSGWDAADVTMQVSHDGGATYHNLHSMTAEQTSGSFAGNRSVGPFDIHGATHLKVRSGTGAAAVNQVDGVTLNVTVTDN